MAIRYLIQVQYRTLFLNSWCGGILFIRPAKLHWRTAATSGPLPIWLRMPIGAVPSRGPISLIALGKMHAGYGTQLVGSDSDRTLYPSAYFYFLAFLKTPNGLQLIPTTSAARQCGEHCRTPIFKFSNGRRLQFKSISAHDARRPYRGPGNKLLTWRFIRLRLSTNYAPLSTIRRSSARISALR